MPAGVTLLRGAEGDYAQWSKAHGGAYDGFLLSTANAFPAQLASVLEHLQYGRVAEAERCSAAISAAVADAFAAVVEVRQGNAFTNANKALAHIMAYGRDALEAPPPAAPRRQPHSILKVVMRVADAPRAPTRTRLPREPLVRIPLGCRCQQSALSVGGARAAVIAAIDQHVADAGGAHFAEGDFLGVGGHGLVNVTRQTPKRGPVLEILGRKDRTAPGHGKRWCGPRNKLRL